MIPYMRAWNVQFEGRKGKTENARVRRYVVSRDGPADWSCSSSFLADPTGRPNLRRQGSGGDDQVQRERGHQPAQNDRRNRGVEIRPALEILKAGSSPKIRPPLLLNPLPFLPCQDCIFAMPLESSALDFGLPQNFFPERPQVSRVTCRYLGKVKTPRRAT